MNTAPILRVTLSWVAMIAGLTSLAPLARAQTAPAPPDVAALAADFAHPPAAARPWVYWFWNNGNVTREGITADLEAMRRVGIGGVIIMDVVEKFAPPRGPATFMGDEWRDLFQFAVQEAGRLGLEINMTNGPGWCGSSGPWITPELSMQKLIVSETSIEGPKSFDGVLPPPDLASAREHKDNYDSKVKAGDFYRDVAVLAFPESADGVIPRASIVDLTGKMDAAGRLTWEAPAGKWTVQRIGHASTGASTRPPVLGGDGLECDKLSAAAMDVHFKNMLARLLERAGPAVGKTLVATHIDSWESGDQDWTDLLPEEFKARRGYDLRPYLVEYGLKSRRQVDNKAMGDRFRWDFYQTIGELLVKNYTGRLATLAHEHGLRLTTEGYDVPFGDEAAYTSAADEPMTEFWMNTSWATPKNVGRTLKMASAAHVNGRPIMGAEAFTSDGNEMWKLHPALLKATGDQMFSLGVNRFVFHRYAHQPYMDRAPGVTMGPWGLHYERTNTWWEMSGAWHEYLARCQQTLRQGTFVADVLYLRSQWPNLGTFDARPKLPTGYRADDISAAGLLERVTVKDGRLTLPDGMSYRLLVMPPVAEITPEVAEKVRDLVRAGACVYGPRPTHAPGLTDFPHCDERVTAVAAELWGDAVHTPVDRTVGTGRVFSNVALDQALHAVGSEPDFRADAELNWMHRKVGATDVYFVANPGNTEVAPTLTLRSSNPRAERWNPESGGRFALSATAGEPGMVRVPLRLGPTESCFVVLSADETPGLAERMDSVKPLQELTGPWEVRFSSTAQVREPLTMDHLASWTDSTDERVKHYSGTAVYARTFTFDPAGQRVALDLGDVQVMARVTLNGKDLGVAWKPPYRVEVTNALRPGENRLEVAVVNLWPNRMIGDAALPEKDRVSWSTWEPFKADMPLLPSGLLGPVRLMAMTRDRD